MEDDVDFKQLSAGRIKMVNAGKKIYIPAVVFHGQVRRLHKICKTATDAQKYAARLIEKGTRMKNDN